MKQLNNCFITYIKNCESPIEHHTCQKEEEKWNCVDEKSDHPLSSRDFGALQLNFTYHTKN
jgi:hypothetical protein